MNKHERQQAEKLKATYEKLVERPIWKDILMWILFSAIFLFAIEYFTVREEEYFLTGPHLLRTLAKIVVMTAVMVLLTRWINRKGLASINKKLKDS
jgi:hypothetical protein